MPGAVLTYGVIANRPGLRNMPWPVNGGKLYHDLSFWILWLRAFSCLLLSDFLGGTRYLPDIFSKPTTKDAANS
ncbi:MAG: hypothetical protein M0Z41_12530 [Peptococcaceae bacterium]|jgi:hypothetical protein|nr:hypothetical protein [Peptococcaceae bacterium]